MTLRTSALVAGLLGLVLLAVGLIADSRRPEADVVATQLIETPVAVFGPEVVGYEPLRRIAIERDGDIVAHSSRPADADAWLATREAVEITGLSAWESVALTTYVAPAPPAAPSPSASPSASPSPSPDTAPEPSPSPSPDAEADAAQDAEFVDASSGDHWRETWNGHDRLAVYVSSIPAGETFIVQSTDGEPLGTLYLYAERDPNDAWITPLIMWGGLLTLVGLIGVVYTLIDLRPWQRKGEEWARKRAAQDEPKEGSRRARRLAGAQIPVVELEDTAQLPQADQKGGEQ